ncbi:MAG: hypothetical protein IPP87_08645 [Ideonella sp.]|nr:hypothetical protein [Ideonella sp.]
MKPRRKQRGLPMAERDYFPRLLPQGDEVVVRALGSSPDDADSPIYRTLPRPSTVPRPRCC